MLEEDRVDMAICSTYGNVNTEKYICVDIFKDCYGLIVPENHPFAVKASVSSMDLAAYEGQIAINNRTRFTTQWMFVTNTLEAVVPDIELVDILNGLTDNNAVPLLRGCPCLVHKNSTLSLDERLRFIPLVNPRLEFSVSLLWKKSKSSRLIQAFANAIKDVSRTLDLDAPSE